MVNIKNGWASAVKELDEKIEDSGSEAPTVDTLTGATTVGKKVMKATDAAAARTAIGAGTSSLVVGTGATQAKAGNWTPTIAQVTGLQAALDALEARLAALETPTGG